jgi:ankyrin repeat protein
LHCYPTQVVNALLSDSRTDPNSTDAEERTPLHGAAIAGHAAVVRALADAGADLHAADVRGETAIHYAAFFGHTDVIVELLSAGAEPNVQDYDGISPLHWAAFKVLTHCTHTLAGVHVSIDAHHTICTLCST